MSRQKHDTVTWETPPPPSHGRYDWEAIAKQLVAKPGEWAKVFDRDHTSLANAIRIHSVKALLRAHGFEVRTTNNVRQDPDFGGRRTCTMYLRYNPETDTRGGK